MLIKVLVPSSWLLEASIGENNIVGTDKGESGEGTASATTLEEIEQETSRTAGKADDVLSLVKWGKCTNFFQYQS